MSWDSNQGLEPVGGGLDGIALFRRRFQFTIPSGSLSVMLLYTAESLSDSFI